MRFIFIHLFMTSPPKLVILFPSLASISAGTMDYVTLVAIFYLSAS